MNNQSGTTSDQGQNAKARTVIKASLGIVFGAIHDLIEALMQGAGQRGKALRVVQQIVLDIGIADHHPHVAEDLEQHARGTTGAARVAQLIKRLPHGFAEKTQHDLTVGKRGVIVGDLANAR